MSVTILFICLNSACKHAPFLAVRKSIVAVESRASEVHFTLGICDVSCPRPSSYSVVLLGDVPSAPKNEVVLQVQEGVVSAVVEISCGAAHKYKYRLYREGDAVDKEEDKDACQS